MSFCISNYELNYLSCRISPTFFLFFHQKQIRELLNSFPSFCRNKAPLGFKSQNQVTQKMKEKEEGNKKKF